MRSLRALLVVLMCGFSSWASSLHAEVQTTLQFFGALEPDEPFVSSDVRIVSDSKTRDDATARATAAAAADIGTGELTAKATGQRFVSGESEIAASALARAVDTLTIQGPGTDAIPVTFEMAAEGDLIVPGSATGASIAFASVQGALGIVGQSERATLQRRRTYDAAGAVLTDSVFGDGDFEDELPVAGDHFDLLLRFDTEIVPGTPFDFESELRALVGSRGALGSDAISDFGNTARFTIILPPDYSFTSASGVFLAGPIPEPETWMLLALGLTCLAAVTARRRRAIP